MLNNPKKCGDRSLYSKRDIGVDKIDIDAPKESYAIKNPILGGGETTRLKNIGQIDPIFPGRDASSQNLWVATT